MSKKIKPKKYKKAIWIHDWGTYGNQTVVSVGMKPKEVAAWMKKQKLKAEAIELFEKYIDEMSNLYNDECAITWNRKCYTALLLQPFRDEWNYYDTLVHECNHLIHAILYRSRLMSNEEEACSYQLEFLFRTIRRKLHKIYKI